MKNRLKYNRAYLVGPMDFAREKGKIWRDDIGEFLETLGVIVLNPYEKPLDITHGDLSLEDDISAAKRKQWLIDKDYENISASMKLTRAVDLRMVDHADFIVAYLDFDIIMTGTLEEIVTANREKKPIIILSPVDKNKIPPWYFGMLPHELFFETIQEVKDYILHIHQDNDIDLLNRWVFFNLEDIIKKIGRK